MDIFEFLQNGQIPESENPGLDPLDPRFSEISDLAENGDFETLKEKGEALVRDKIYDLRIIPSLLLSYFLTEPAKNLNPVILALDNLYLPTNFQNFGPSRKKEKNASAALLKFLKSLTQNLDHFQSEFGADFFSDQFDENSLLLTKNLGNLQNSLNENLNKPGFAEKELRKLQESLQSFQNLFEEKQNLAKEEELLEVENEKPVPKEEKQLVQKEFQAAQSPVQTMESTALKELKNKLAAFEHLVEKEELAKAALIAKDITFIVENFDPRVFFPEIFSDFYKLLNQNIEDILGYQENSGTAYWENMEQLYKINLKEFMDL